jgi:hypothetical protein
MNIPLVNTAPAPAASVITPLAPTQVQYAIAAQSVAALIAQTTVDLSPLGKFLSAVTLFQRRMLELQANPAAVAESEEALAALTSSVTALTDSANALQASLITGTSDDQSLATLFDQQFDAQSATPGDSDRLAAIGLTVSSDGLAEEGAFAVDPEVLQAALLNDPAGTTALLTRAAAAFGTLAGAVPEATADPSILFADDPVANDPLALTPTATAQNFPDINATPEPVTSDSAFFQELLAETPKPALALTQAPPPAVAEANATFAAQRLADTAQPLAQPALPPAASNEAADTRTPPGLGQLPPAAAPAPATTAAADNPASRPDDNREAALANQRSEAAQTLAAQDAARAANARIADNLTAEREAGARLADTIAAERDANERIGATMSAERAAQAALQEERQAGQAERARLAAQDVEASRLARERDELRLDRARTAEDLADNDEALPDARREPAVTTLVQPMPPADPPLAAVTAPAVPPPANNAQQLARDPATLAAIAAYNLSAGPFAALAGRRELAAPRADTVPAVDTVRKVAAIDTDAATGESSRPSR